MLTTDKREYYLNIYFEKLTQLGINVSILKEKYGEKLMNATFTNSNEFGNAYDGSFLEILLIKLTPYAVRLNELLPDDKKVDKQTLVKVCLLHQIAKCVRMVPNDNQWEIDKRKMLYKYDDSLPSIRTGFHSMVMAQECGITFTVEEAEAMIVNDRDATDEQARWFSSKMATIIRQANELTYIDINNKK